MHTSPEPQSRLSTWVGFLALCVGMFMAILDTQIVASSLPDIQTALGIPASRLSWIQTAYLIAEVIAIPLTGWLTALLSLRGLFIVAVVGFTLASLGCALSAHLEMLLVFRILQGFWGGTLIPIVFSAIFLLFPVRLHVVATTLGGVFAVLAPTVGPVLGGYITENYSWHWLFLINIVPGIVVIAASWGTLERHPPDWRQWARLDVVALLFMALCLSSLELLLKEGPTQSWGGPYVMTLMIIFPCAGTFFVRRCKQVAYPLVHLNSFSNPCFVLGCVYSFVLGIGLYCSVYLLPLYLSFVRMHTAFEIGKIMIVMGAAQLVVAPVAALAEKHIHPLVLTGVGYALFSAGLISNGFMTIRTDYDDLFWPQILRGGAMLLCLLPTTRLALEGQTEKNIPNASGLFNLMRTLGGAVGIALGDTILEQRGPLHGVELTRRLMAGDPDAARWVGLPLDRFHNVPLDKIDQPTMALVKPMVERAALTLSFNEAWLTIGMIFIFTLLLLPLMRWSLRTVKLK